MLVDKVLSFHQLGGCQADKGNRFGCLPVLYRMVLLRRSINLVFDFYNNLIDELLQKGGQVYLASGAWECVNGRELDSERDADPEQVCYVWEACGIDHTYVPGVFFCLTGFASWSVVGPLGWRNNRVFRDEESTS
ncbi:hypothetical protein LINPERHAP1_LOCUS10074 [Linum perenne]